MKSGAPNRRPTARLLAMLRVPAIGAGILLIPFGIYFLHVRSQREYLIKRHFRVLATMGDQIKAKVDNLESVIRSAQEEVPTRVVIGGDRLGFRDFLKPAKIECVEDKACKPPFIKPPLHVTIGRDRGDSWLYLHGTSNDGHAGIKDKDVHARIKLDAIIRPFLPTGDEAVFEEVVIADQHDGRVLYQQMLSGL